MKRFLLLILAIAAAVSVSAQDRLSTCSHYSIVSDDYHRLVDNRLGVSDPAVKWSYLVMPSFSPEYSVTCKIGKYGAELIAFTPKESIWYASDRKAVKVKSDTLRINREQAARLDALFRLAVESSTFLPDTSSFSIEVDEEGHHRYGFQEIGLDGETYVFMSRGRAAQCWSPDKGACLDMARTGDMLYSAVTGSDKSVLNEVMELVDPTMDKLLTQVPDWYPAYLEAETYQQSSIYYNDTPERAEPSHMHLSARSGAYVLEMDGRSFEGGKSEILDLMSDFSSNSLLIVDDGSIPWGDARDFISCTGAKQNGHTAVLNDVSQNQYWKERGISSLLTVMPMKKPISGSENMKLEDVAARLNAAFTSDRESKGKVLLRPKYDSCLEPLTFDVFEVVSTPDELLLMYRAGQKNRFAVTMTDDLALKVGEKVYELTASDGMADWYDNGQYYIPNCSKSFEKVFCAHFPVLPDGTEEFDVIESRTGRVLVKGLKLTDKAPENAVARFECLGYHYQGSFLGGIGAGNVDTSRVIVNSLECYKDRTVLTLTHHRLLSGMDVFGMGMENTVLQLNGGRALNLVEIDGKALDTRKGIDWRFIRTVGDYVFQMVFEPMTDKEIAAMRKDVQKALKTGLPDFRGQAIDALANRNGVSQSASIHPAAMCRLSGPDDSGSLSSMLSGTQQTITIDIYPSN